MRPNVYFDIEAIASFNDTGMSSPLLRGRMLTILHPLFAAKPHTYALALPSGRNSVLRIFTTTRTDLDGLVAELRQNAWMRDYTRFGYPAEVPENYTGIWTSFRRYRVPSLSSDRKTGEEYGRLRQRRMQCAAKEKMDYFILRSASTGQRFSLVVCREQGQVPQGECLPNSYGLCGQENLFCVPDLP
ncbi:MAG: type I-F CRISPR-associated endoribonuclease Cas6/Csy4 [Deltaproteobacteria bacterium]|nr:type I-F CRISPR-associated endoribonuclease Cas6/Csy4 [Deltaproteobacteria bacterium]